VVQFTTTTTTTRWWHTKVN